jgi:hypothetical protein
MTGDSPDQDKERKHFEVTGSVSDGPGIVAGSIGNVNVGTAAPGRLPDGLVELAGYLALTAAERWEAEQARLINDQAPLPVRWTTAGEALFDYWPNIHGVRSAESPPPVDLSGSMDEIGEVYRKVPSRRLVILGRAGSGKTVLALHLLLRLLHQRRSDEPVPEIFSLGSWNPEVPLRVWLAQQLARDYPFLAAKYPDGKTQADYFVERGAILPILDGFDEIAEGLHETALEALRQMAGPMVLTSRTEEYRRAVEGKNRGLTRAPAIELSGLAVDDVAEYLEISGPTTNRPAWTEVFGRVRAAPGSAASANLAETLSTPLLVGVARDVCNREAASGLSPGGLLETAQESDTPEEVENRLLGAFMPSAYRRVPGRSARRWDPGRARRWLGFLAGHMDALKTGELEWWRLGTTISLAQRTVIIGIMTALCFGTSTVVENVIVDTFGTTYGVGFAVQRAFVVGVLHGIVVGAAFGVFHLLASRHDSLRPAPVRIRLTGPRDAAVGARVAARLSHGVPGALAVALMIVLIDRLVLPPLGLNDGLGGPAVYAFVFVAEIGLVMGLSLAVSTWLEVPIEVRKAVSPRGMLAANRVNVLFYLPIWALVTGPIGGVVQSFSSGLTISVEAGFAYAGVVAFGVGLSYLLALTAWGQWVALARIWLPLRGRLPWRLLTFLDDACDRGILRQVGATYQFRHARLKEQLADQLTAVPRPRPRS